ncbi:hypothetical protein CC78DRAFT_583986 [Lojkania enalia]|uniref:RNase MRP protein 1 RNA binding domain-containing protein n=1 Tax=Lojkania enalia TaxID=147567 RepID=A0A9P4K4G9_9PLEO|nr:hypothetical protein CC78DRAFT_583986 [Didymosphaeria enalia]
MAVLNSLQPIPVHTVAFEPLDMIPKLTATKLLRASDKDKQALADIHELLDRLFVRNRHQHRRNHWFKSLQQFRKQLALLIKEMESGKVNVANVLEQRLRFWDERHIHQWYLNFTQLVAVGPFAVIGLVLMACVARVCRITGITDLYEEIGSEDMKVVLQSMDEGVAVGEFGNILGGEEDDEEDQGVIIERY